MRRVKAVETLDDPERCSRLSLDGFYRLLIEAGYPPDDAQEAANQRGWNRLNSGASL